MQSRDDKDWIVRQVKSFGEGLGYILSHGKSNGGVEIVLPDKIQKQLPYQNKLHDLIDKKEYCKATTKLKKLRYSMEEEQFVELSR